MRAPRFWRVDGAPARRRAPRGALYGALARRLLTRAAPRAALPTIVVGGLTTGGDGKTPLVLALADLLREMGERPALLTRGYGARRRGAGPVVASPENDAEKVGDEALLLARRSLAISGADRVAGAALAERLGASVLILDDGFHSRRLAADLKLLAIDAEYGAGNGRCLPAGPLRAPLEAQLAAADALVVIGKSVPSFAIPQHRIRASDSRLAPATAPMFRARMIADARGLTGARVVAFAGIGRPEKFFRTLAETGAQIVATRAFPDHHRYSETDLTALARLAEAHSARLVTTEKDAVRISSARPPADLTPLSVTLAFDDRRALETLLARALREARLSRVS